MLPPGGEEPGSDIAGEHERQNDVSPRIRVHLNPITLNGDACRSNAQSPCVTFRVRSQGCGVFPFDATILD